MPNLTGEEADHEAAPKFIDEIYEGHGFRLPNQIIGFTAYDEEYENLKLRFEEKLWSIIKYSQGEINWKTRIRSKVNHLLNSKSRLIESITSKNKFDVGIICALSEEFLEMKKAFGDKWKRENDIDFPVPIYSTELVTANANTIRICAVCIGEVGLVPATAMTTAMIMYFSPQALFMTGITAGFKDRDLKLGDLVISKSVSEPIIGKIVGDDNEIELKREYHVLKTDVKLYGYAQELSSDVEFISDFNKHLKTINLLQEDSNLKIICAPTVTIVR